MYVMNKKWDSITNIAQCTSVYVSPEHEIKAVPTGGGNVYRLGQYETAEIARAVLNDLYMHRLLAVPSKLFRPFITHAASQNQCPLVVRHLVDTASRNVHIQVIQDSIAELSVA